MRTTGHKTWLPGEKNQENQIRQTFFIPCRTMLLFTHVCKASLGTFLAWTWHCNPVKLYGVCVNKECFVCMYVHVYGCVCLCVHIHKQLTNVFQSLPSPWRKRKVSCHKQWFNELYNFLVKGLPFPHYFYSENTAGIGIFWAANQSCEKWSWYVLSEF